MAAHQPPAENPAENVIISCLGDPPGGVDPLGNVSTNPSSSVGVALEINALGVVIEIDRNQYGDNRCERVALNVL
jgi:hypothetical protein